MGIRKSFNIFLSLFGFKLECDPKDNDDFEIIGIVDEKGLRVGFLIKKDNGDCTFDIVTLRYGTITGEVKLSKYLEKTQYSITSTMNKNNFSFENKLYDKITDNMDIRVPNLDYEGNVEIDNKMSIYYKNELLFAFNVNAKDKKIIFLTPLNEVAISRNLDGTCSYKATNSEKDKINIYFENGVLVYEYFDKEGIQKGSGSKQIQDEDTAIEAMCKLATETGKKDGMSSVKDTNYFVREIRRICCYGEELCVFNNIASIVLGSMQNTYDKIDIQAILGFVPWELPNTPVVKEDGTILSPRDKKSPKKRPN